MYDFKHQNFTGLHAVIWSDVAIPGLAAYGTIDWVVLFGLGPAWREGDAYLAVVPLSSLTVSPTSPDSHMHFLERLDVDGRPV